MSSISRAHGQPRERYRVEVHRVVFKALVMELRGWVVPHLRLEAGRPG